MPVFQPRGESGEEINACFRKLIRKRFGARFQFGKMIGGRLNEITHAINRIVYDRRLAALVFVQSLLARAAFLQIAIGGVEPLHGIRHGRREVGQFAHLVARHRCCAEEGVGKHFVEFALQPRFFFTRKATRIDIEGFRQPDQHLRGHGALVALHQIEIACGNAEFRRHAGLREPQFAAQTAHACARENFASGIGHGFNSRLVTIIYNITYLHLSSYNHVTFEGKCPSGAAHNACLSVISSVKAVMSAL